ncbi:MAG: hypothetical protein R2705_16315 [Ilumatobacteraceae bacterium]
MTAAIVHLDERQLRRLAKLTPSGPAVSVHLPSLVRARTDPAVPSSGALARAVRSSLSEGPWALDDGTVDAMTDAVVRVLETYERPAEDGLAVFVTQDTIETFRISEPPTARVHVGDHFDLAPTAAAVARHTEFHLLVLSQHRTELYRCDEHDAVRVPVPGLPHDTAEAFWFLDREPDPMVSPKDLRHADLDQYVSIVDHALPAEVRHGPLPLVVAGVDHVAARFQAVHREPGLVLLTSLGAPDRVSIGTLRRAALGVLDVGDTVHGSEVIERFRGLDGTGRTVTELTEIEQAAAEGRLDVLLVALADHEPIPTDRDPRVIAAVVDALRTGSAVIAVAAGSIGEETAAVGIVRF